MLLCINPSSIVYNCKKCRDYTSSNRKVITVLLAAQPTFALAMMMQIRLTVFAVTLGFLQRTDCGLKHHSTHCALPGVIKHIVVQSLSFHGKSQSACKTIRYWLPCCCMMLKWEEIADPNTQQCLAANPANYTGHNILHQHYNIVFLSLDPCVTAFGSVIVSIACFQVDDHQCGPLEIQRSSGL